MPRNLDAQDLFTVSLTVSQLDNQRSTMLWILYFLGFSCAQYTSRPYIKSSEDKGQSYSHIPSVQVPLSAHGQGACSITDKYCSYNGTARKPDGLGYVCLLWDDTCSGNWTLAINQFFGQKREILFENVCFAPDGDAAAESNCTLQNTPTRSEVFERIKSWMRSPQCIASQAVYHKGHPPTDMEIFQGEKRGYGERDNSTQNRKYGGGTCCGICNIEAGNVDIYYWPVSHANTSCLSIIGNKVNAPDYGATTDSNGIK